MHCSIKTMLMKNDKDAFYFPHDDNAKDDPRTLKMIFEHGVEAYGIYWILLELLRPEREWKLAVDMLKIHAARYNTTYDKCLNVVENTGLFIVDDEGNFYSPAFTRRMKKIEQMREQKRMAGKRSGEARRAKSNESNDNEQRSNSVQTEPEQKGTGVEQERKGKETKGKKKKSKKETIKERNNRRIEEVKEYYLSEAEGHPLQKWIVEQKFTYVMQLEIQITREQCTDILGGWKKENVKSTLIQMNNWKPLLEKNTTVAGTLRTWLTKEYGLPINQKVNNADLKKRIADMSEQKRNHG